MTHGDAVTARKYIDEAIGLERKLNRRPYLAVRYGVASEIYLKLGEAAQALEFTETALQMDSTDGRWDKVAVRRSQKAGILMKMGQDGNNLNSLAISIAQIGEIAFEAGEVSAAEKGIRGMSGSVHGYRQQVYRVKSEERPVADVQGHSEG